MSLKYAERWSRWQCRLLSPLEPEEAKVRHAQRKLYSALLFNGGKPFCFLELNLGGIAVGFLDSNLRDYVVYVFSEEKPGQLFLQRATYREYVGDARGVARADIYYFRSDGRVIVEKNDLLKQTQERAEFTKDLSGNWEPYPEFGQYDSITRLER